MSQRPVVELQPERDGRGWVVASVATPSPAEGWSRGSCCGSRPGGYLLVHAVRGELISDPGGGSAWRVAGGTGVGAGLQAPLRSHDQLASRFPTVKAKARKSPQIYYRNWASPGGEHGQVCVPEGLTGQRRAQATCRSAAARIPRGTRGGLACAHRSASFGVGSQSSGQVPRRARRVTDGDLRVGPLAGFSGTMADEHPPAHNPAAGRPPIVGAGLCFQRAERTHRPVDADRPDPTLTPFAEIALASGHRPGGQAAAFHTTMADPRGPFCMRQALTSPVRFTHEPVRPPRRRRESPASPATAPSGRSGTTADATSVVTRRYTSRLCGGC